MLVSTGYLRLKVKAMHDISHHHQWIDETARNTLQWRFGTARYSQKHTDCHDIPIIQGYHHPLRPSEPSQFQGDHRCSRSLATEINWDSKSQVCGHPGNGPEMNDNLEYCHQRTQLVIRRKLCIEVETRRERRPRTSLRRAD
jgi:hypothetical protein